MSKSYYQGHMSRTPCLNVKCRSMPIITSKICSTDRIGNQHRSYQWAIFQITCQVFFHIDRHWALIQSVLHESQTYISNGFTCLFFPMHTMVLSYQLRNSNRMKCHHRQCYAQNRSMHLALLVTIPSCQAWIELTNRTILLDNVKMEMQRFYIFQNLEFFYSAPKNCSCFNFAIFE